jgi:tripartite-type tricarboxylate transporter receptor subunit TctC
MRSITGYAFLAAASIVTFGAWPHAAFAQKPAGLPGSYPSKPIRVIVGTAPGGGTDIITRPIMQKLSEKWDVPIVVENRVSGVGSVMAMNHAVKATPDGYTLLIGSASTFLNAALVLKVPYDVIKAFDPVALFTMSPFVMVVPVSSPARNVRGFLDYAKTKKGSLNYAISGVGSSGHLAGEWMKLAGGIEMTHVPYKGIGPAIIDMMGGRIDMLFATPTASIPHVRSGKLRAIAVTSGKRAKSLPDIPAVSETLPDFDVSTWFGALAPAGTPQPIIAALNRELNAILALPDIQKLLTTDGSEVVPLSPKEFRGVVASGITKLDRVIKQTGIKLE